MEEKKNLTKKPVRFQFEIGYGQFIVSLLVLGLFFLLPIQLISNWTSISQGITRAFSSQGQPQVAGIYTDNTGRYLNIPILNFSFDTTMRDSATISFTFGSILIVLSIIIVLLLFADFRKKEMKYR
jgi:uncharacterized membrane protein YjgN (DUF898 family)